MAFDGLILDDQHRPVENQPVPLRLAPFIFGMPTIDYMMMIIEANELDGLGIKVYEYTETKDEKEVHPHKLKALISSKSISLKNIPAEYYVKSEDLIAQMTNYVDNTIGDRQLAANLGHGLIWNPGLGKEEPDIKACSNFHHILPANLKNIKAGLKRRQNTEKRNLELMKVYKDYESDFFKKHPSATKYSDTQAAKEMNKDPRHGLNKFESGSLRKLIGKIKKMDKPPKKIKGPN